MIRFRYFDSSAIDDVSNEVMFFENISSLIGKTIHCNTRLGNHELFIFVILQQTLQIETEYADACTMWVGDYFTLQPTLNPTQLSLKVTRRT